MNVGFNQFKQKNNQEEQQNKNKMTQLGIIGILVLIIGLVGITYAFFNYTRTGTTNTIKVGRISFNSNQTETINLTNVFPIASSNVDSDTTNVDEAVITITGDTTYTEGIEYLLTATDVSNTVGTENNQKTVPISIQVTANNGLGNADASYFDNRGDDSSIYKVLAEGEIEDGGKLLVGYITNGQVGINGTVTIKAYLDKDKIGISDTYDGTESEIKGTTTEWVDDRTILTTTEWNTLQTNGVSFKVKVEANEGIWVEEPVAPIPTIDSCPGCKFIYTSNVYIFSETNTMNEPRSTISDIESNNDVLVDDYTLLNKNYFYGFKIENNTLVKAYSCGIKGENPNAGTAFCLEAALDNSTYESNYNLLVGSTLWNGNCDFYDNKVMCYGAINASAVNNGGVDVAGDNGYCYIPKDNYRYGLVVGCYN